MTSVRFFSGFCISEICFAIYVFWFKANQMRRQMHCTSYIVCTKIQTNFTEIKTRKCMTVLYIQNIHKLKTSMHLLNSTIPYNNING